MTDDATNLRIVGCASCGLRVVDLNDPAQAMCGDCEILGPDGKPLGWRDGIPTGHVPDPKWWGNTPSPEQDRLIAIIHHALFAEDGDRGPVFRWCEHPLAADDDPYLSCAADQVAFVLLDRRDEVAALLAAIVGSELAS